MWGSSVGGGGNSEQICATSITSDYKQTYQMVLFWRDKPFKLKHNSIRFEINISSVLICNYCIIMSNYQLYPHHHHHHHPFNVLSGIVHVSVGKDVPNYFTWNEKLQVNVKPNIRLNKTDSLDFNWSLAYAYILLPDAFPSQTVSSFALSNAWRNM